MLTLGKNKNMKLCTWLWIMSLSFVCVCVCLCKRRRNSHSRTGHEGPVKEKRCSSTLPLISAPDVVGGQRHAPATTSYLLYRRLDGPHGRSRGVCVVPVLTSLIYRLHFVVELTWIYKPGVGNKWTQFNWNSITFTSLAIKLPDWITNV